MYRTYRASSASRTNRAITAAVTAVRIRTTAWSSCGQTETAAKVRTGFPQDSSAAGRMYCCLQPRPTWREEILLRVATPAVFHRRCEICPETTPVAEARPLPRPLESPL